MNLILAQCYWLLLRSLNADIHSQYRNEWKKIRMQITWRFILWRFSKNDPIKIYSIVIIAKPQSERWSIVIRYTTHSTTLCYRIEFSKEQYHDTKQTLDSISYRFNHLCVLKSQWGGSEFSSNVEVQTNSTSLRSLQNFRLMFTFTCFPVRFSASIECMSIETVLKFIALLIGL